jgi:hypothetical protein
MLQTMLECAIDGLLRGVLVDNMEEEKIRRRSGQLTRHDTEATAVHRYEHLPIIPQPSQWYP